MYSRMRLPQYFCMVEQCFDILSVSSLQICNKNRRIGFLYGDTLIQIEKFRNFPLQNRVNYSPRGYTLQKTTFDAIFGIYTLRRVL